MIGRRQYSESAKKWLWRPSCFSKIAENQYQPSLCHLISIWNVWWRYIHNFSFNWSDVVDILSQQKNGCVGHLVFQKLLKINTSQVYATLYPYETFGEDIFITFPLIDRTSSIFWVSKKWLWRSSCFSKIAENQYQPSLCHLISIWNVWWRYIHNFSFNWSDVVNILSQQKNGCVGHLVFQKLLKINTSQVYATLYPYETFGEDIFITFPLIDRTSSIFWVSKKWLWRPSCFSKIAENQYQPSYWHHRHVKKKIVKIKWSDKVSCRRLTPRVNTNKNYMSPLRGT